MARRSKTRKPLLAPKEAVAMRNSAQANSGVAGDDRAAVFLGPAVMALAALGMIWWTWMTWPDVLVDFGREIYIPWRLAEGETLYTDLAYYLGPLSPYINSVWFRLFGETLLVLVIGNLLVWTAILVMVYRLLRDVADRFAATVACLVFILLFSFSQYVPISNYNFVCPYSHETTHGLALALAALLCWSNFAKTGHLRHVIAGGFLWGVSFLTRVEPFVATGAAIAVGLTAQVVLVKHTTRRLATIILVLVVSAVVPVLLSIAALSAGMPVGEAVRGTFGSLLSVLSSNAMSQKFYLDGLGMTNPGERLVSIACWSAGYFGFFVVAVGASLLIRKGSTVVRWTVAILVSLILGTLVWHFVSPGRNPILLPAVFRPLPVLIAVFGVAATIQLLRMRKGSASCGCILFVLPLITFAALMLGKMLLNPRIFHYGFTLAMPATLLVVVALVDWMPRLLDQRRAFGGGFQLTAVTVIGVVVVAHLCIVSNSMNAKKKEVGSGGNVFRADWRGEFVGSALALIEEKIKPDETLAVLPEGVILNFLSGRKNPVPYTTYGSVEVMIFGEDKILASFESDPPDFIFLVHQDGSEFGPRFFGRDYARKIGTWITADYHSLEPLIGAPPLQDNRFGILLLERNDRDRS